MDQEGSYVCDSCGEEIVIPIDVSAGQHQEYVEDCPICCCPNVIHVEIDEDGAVRQGEPHQNLPGLPSDDKVENKNWNSPGLRSAALE